MAWDQKSGGHYCDRCEAAIWMDSRQKKYQTPNGAKAGDPYLAVSRVAFFEPEKPLYSGYMYCFDCEPTVMAVLKALNYERNREPTVGSRRCPECGGGRAVKDHPELPVFHADACKLKGT